MKHFIRVYNPEQDLTVYLNLDTLSAFKLVAEDELTVTVEISVNQTAFKQCKIMHNAWAALLESVL